MVITPGGHKLVFSPDFDRSFTLLNVDEICDLIDIFFRYDDGDAIWRIVAVNDTSSVNGQHSYNPATHEHIISLNEKSIKKYFNKGRRNFGGNLNLPDMDIKTAAGAVFVHELQHANQSRFHSGPGLFYGNIGGVNKNGKPRMKRYRTRACERDAREFIDANINKIFSYFGCPLPRRHRQTTPDASREFTTIIDSLCKQSQINVHDVKEELRTRYVLNPRNVEIVIDTLNKRGIKLINRAAD